LLIAFRGEVLEYVPNITFEKQPDPRRIFSQEVIPDATLQMARKWCKTNRPVSFRFADSFPNTFFRLVPKYFFLLDPKFHLGTHALLKFYFSLRIGPDGVLPRSITVAKRIFAGKCVPKCNLETCRTEQKGTDDEIAIRNEEWMPSASIGYFVVCPFLAILYADDFKNVELDFRLVPKFQSCHYPHLLAMNSSGKKRMFEFNIPTGFRNKAQGCGTPLPWVGSYPPIPVYPNGVTLHWCKYCIRKPT